MSLQRIGRKEGIKLNTRFIASTIVLLVFILVLVLLAGLYISLKEKYVSTPSGESDVTVESTTTTTPTTTSTSMKVESNTTTSTTTTTTTEIRESSVKATSSTTTSTTTSTTLSKYQIAACIGSNIETLYMRDDSICPGCRKIREVYGEYLQLFKVRDCEEKTEREKCIDEIKAYGDENRLYSALTLGETNIVSFPTVVIENNAYTSVNPETLETLTHCVED